MNDKLPIEHDGDLTPEGRAKVLAEVLRFLTTKMEPVPYGTLLSHVMMHFGSREELVSAHVMHATLELLISGLLASNTYHASADEKAFMVEQTTVVGPSRQLTGYAYREYAE